MLAGEVGWLVGRSVGVEPVKVQFPVSAGVLQLRLAEKDLDVGFSTKQLGVLAVPEAKCQISGLCDRFLAMHLLRNGRRPTARVAPAEVGGKARESAQLFVVHHPVTCLLARTATPTGNATQTRRN